MIRRSLILAAAAAVLLAATAPSAQAQTASAQCPTFRVLHNDQIGTALFPKGVYSVSATGVSCTSASQLFAQFLQDYDGNLAKPWRVNAQGSGRATFTQGSAPGFSVAIINGTPPTPPPPAPHGTLCPGGFRVLDDDRIGRVNFPRGAYAILIPRNSIITCAQASSLFRRFLNFPAGNLPKAWRVKRANAMFFKPANPQRKRFRVDPAVGSSGL